jgi:serine/threonine protein kinase
MYNYGVVSNAYIIVMKKYDCSLRDWILRFKESLHTKVKQILKIYWDILNIVLLLHEKSVTHYDIKADNILLMLDEEG